MATLFSATYDGSVLHPDEPLPLAPNTRVVFTIEKTGEDAPRAAGSFLRKARSLNLDGPPDWSERIDDYLYGEAPDGEK